MNSSRRDSPSHLFVLTLLLGSVGLFANGCASVVRGSSEKLLIQSSPSGAEVKLSTGQAGITPYEVEVKRKDTIFITLTKNGYKEFSTAVISGIDGASLGIGTVANFVTLPIINDIVDYKTGANFSHKPNPLVVTLIPLSSPETYQPIPVPAPLPASSPSAPAVAPIPAPGSTATPTISSATSSPAR